MVVEVVVQNGAGDAVVVEVADVVVLVTRATTLSTASLTVSRTMALSPAVMLLMGLTCPVTVTPNKEELTGAVVLWPAPSNMEDG